MKNGCVIPICRLCHDEWEINEQLRTRIQDEAKAEFLKTHTQDQFLKEFGKNYIRK